MAVAEDVSAAGIEGQASDIRSQSAFVILNGGEGFALVFKEISLAKEHGPIGGVGVPDDPELTEGLVFPVVVGVEFDGVANHPVTEGVVALSKPFQL